MQPNIEKLKVYIRVKWVFIIALSLYVILGFFIGPLGLPDFLFCAVLLLASINNLFAQAAARNNFFNFAYYSVSFDMILIVTMLYFAGGMESTWLFIPGLLIFSAGFLFNTDVAVIFAAVAFFSIYAIYFLGYFNAVPHYSAYGFPAAVWKHFEYNIDYLIGMLVLYFAAGLGSGYFNRVSMGSYDQAKKSLMEYEKLHSESEIAQKALLNIMEDLDRSKGELELKVAERTAELEIAKTGLENKVSERTADLEESRKAILHMMRDLKEDLEKLKAVDRMKTEFLSMVSHELRTPITPIMGYISMFLSEKFGKLTPQYRRFAEVIKAESEHLLTLIDSILDVTRIEFGKHIQLQKEPVSINNIIDEVVLAMQPQFDSLELKLIKEMPPDLPTIFADGSQLVRLITNLLGNALKFTPKGGLVKIVGIKQDNAIEIQVIDNGIGITKENMEKIFDKFYQVDSSYTRIAGGVGLGLAIAREIVESHGGKIRVESEGLGRGTKFYIILPLKEEKNG
ncbi:MAG: ATP-binding protein [Candidatus Saganbacteria bacterium]|nr:ATP-binding protein [Candidatus Saganbacteria bacterium]